MTTILICVKLLKTLWPFPPHQFRQNDYLGKLTKNISKHPKHPFPLNTAILVIFCTIKCAKLKLNTSAPFQPPPTTYNNSLL